MAARLVCLRLHAQIPRTTLAPAQMQVTLPPAGSSQSVATQRTQPASAATRTTTLLATSNLPVFLPPRITVSVITCGTSRLAKCRLAMIQKTSLVNAHVTTPLTPPHATTASTRQPARTQTTMMAASATISMTTRLAAPSRTAPMLPWASAPFAQTRSTSILVSSLPSALTLSIKLARALTSPMPHLALSMLPAWEEMTLCVLAATQQT